jgi:hypothetical protein
MISHSYTRKDCFGQARAMTKCFYADRGKGFVQSLHVFLHAIMFRGFPPTAAKL